jgi:hypothetical protein
MEDNSMEGNTEANAITEKIQLSLEKLESSSFYEEFQHQMQDSEMVERIKRVITTDPDHSQLQLVLYGLGKIDSDEVVRSLDHNHMQLSLAILLRERFQWVSDIVVYDPVLSPIERMAINAFNCTCLSVNENGRRKVDKPTLFFMPHCPFDLFANVLEENWMPTNLNKIIILGNNFHRFKEEFYHVLKSMPVILNSDHVLHETPLPFPERRISMRAFGSLSWHFFAASLDDLKS